MIYYYFYSIMLKFEIIFVYFKRNNHITILKQNSFVIISHS